jgi:ABC-2 type transport system ATP-binding protein
MIRSNGKEPHDAMLRVAKLRYTYGPAQALNDINFAIEQGELVVLAGRNGAGKSTLLRCIAGWARPAQGEILIDGKPLSQNERGARQVMMLVPDTPVFYDQLTAWEHLTFIARAYRLDGWEAQAEQLLEHFGLSAQRDYYPFTFSRGMQYKLGLCLALLVEPSLLLLDEPFGPLDPLSSEQLWHDLEIYRDAGIAILLSCHQLPTETQPDRYLLMEQGTLLGDDTPKRLAERFEVRGEPTLDRLLHAAVMQAIRGPLVR